MYWELCLVSTSNKFSLTDSLSPRRARGGELEVPTFWYAKISILWNIPLPVRIAAKRFRWCWTYPCTSKLTWKIAKCAATPLRSVTPCRTTSWRNFRPGLWDDAKLECQRIATTRVGGVALAMGVARNGMDEGQCCKCRMENERIRALHGSALNETG